MRSTLHATTTPILGLFAHNSILDKDFAVVLMAFYFEILSAPKQIQINCINAIYQTYFKYFRKDKDEQEYIRSLVFTESTLKPGILYKKTVKERPVKDYEFYLVPADEKKSHYISWSNNIIYLHKQVALHRPFWLASPPTLGNFMKYGKSGHPIGEKNTVKLSSFAKELIYLLAIGYKAVFDAVTQKINLIPGKNLKKFDPFYLVEDLHNITLNEFLISEKFVNARQNISQLQQLIFTFSEQKSAPIFLEDNAFILNKLTAIEDWDKETNDYFAGKVYGLFARTADPYNVEDKIDLEDAAGFEVAEFNFEM